MWLCRCKPCHPSTPQGQVGAQHPLPRMLCSLWPCSARTADMAAARPAAPLQPPARELTTPADFSINCSFTSMQISVGCLSWVSFQLPPSSCLFLIHAPTCLCTWLGSELTAFLTSLSVIPFAFCSRSTMVTQVRWEPHSRSAAMPVLPPERPSSSVGCSTGQSFADGKHGAAQGSPHCVGSSSRCTQNLVQGN